MLLARGIACRILMRRCWRKRPQRDKRVRWLPADKQTYLKGLWLDYEDGADEAVAAFFYASDRVVAAAADGARPTSATR